jgi:hypothetical protein
MCDLDADVPAEGWTDLRMQAAPSRIDRAGLVASAPIRVGEVLFVWSGEVVDDAALRRIATEGKLHSWHTDPCACGSPLCRRRVTGNDWRRTDLQQRHAGHFSPFINARIARERT